MPPPLQIRRLELSEISALQSLRREALSAHPLAFAASIEDDRTLDTARLTRAVNSPAESALIVAIEAPLLLGMVGVYRHTGRKSAHRAQIWGMYVAPNQRRHGLGSALLHAAIEQARGWSGVTQLQLCVTTDGDAARKLYEGVGFQVWGCAPRALQWEGQFVDEYHLALSLRASESITSAPGQEAGASPITPTA